MNNIHIPKEVLEAFAITDAANLIVEPIGNGLINDSWKIVAENKGNLFLQRINHNVFHEPEQVQDNYLQLWRYTKAANNGLLMPEPVFHNNQNSLFTDPSGNYWRAFHFIPESKTCPVAETAMQAWSTAKTFGQFTAAFANMNTSLLKEVIRNFHHLSLRYRQFETSLHSKLGERIIKASSLITELTQREHYKRLYEKISTSPEEFPQRVMHHDAKISNILFHERTNNILCPVDYDTVMPGYFFSDLGDMIRSMVSPEDEKSICFEKIEVRKDFYNSIVDGYLETMSVQLTSSERKYLHYSGILMTYMQALRFLTDYLDGDTYYRTDYAEQNFDRAFNQFVLLQKLESFLSGKINFQHG
jgi:thiamine kinase-like enzyme